MRTVDGELLRTVCPEIKSSWEELFSLTVVFSCFRTTYSKVGDFLISEVPGAPEIGAGWGSSQEQEQTASNLDYQIMRKGHNTKKGRKTLI